MKKPMSLKDLPGYLNSLRENQTYDDSLVVDMGKITTRKNNTFRNLSFAAAAVLLLTGTGFLTYNLTRSENITIVLYADDVDSESVSKILSEEGGKIVDLKQNEDSYEVKMKIFKNADSFVEKLRKNKEFKKIVIK